jgi:hypothetical protein
VRVLEELEEVRVAGRPKVEQRYRGLPPRRDGDVEVLVGQLLHVGGPDVAQPGVRPLAPPRLLRPHEHDLEPVVERELPRVLHDDAGTAGEAEVGKEEGDLHEPRLL